MNAAIKSSLNPFFIRSRFKQVRYPCQAHVWPSLNPFFIRSRFKRVLDTEISGSTGLNPFFIRSRFKLNISSKPNKKKMS